VLMMVAVMITDLRVHLMPNL
jgi:hypothetical protein